MSDLGLARAAAIGAVFTEQEQCASSVGRPALGCVGRQMPPLLSKVIGQGARTGQMWA